MLMCDGWLGRPLRRWQGPCDARPFLTSTERTCVSGVLCVGRLLGSCWSHGQESDVAVSCGLLCGGLGALVMTALFLHILQAGKQKSKAGGKRQLG